jgi:gliding motility-associated transport system permease protein
MRQILVIARRELASIFLSPIAYVVLVCFLVLNGISFWLIVTFVTNEPSMQMQTSPLQTFFGGTLLYYLPILAVCPLITMRTLAEEHRSGTIEPLMTAPVRDFEVVLGKYFAALVFYVFLWVPTLLYVVLVARNASSLDWGPIGSAYLGTLLIGVLYISVGILMSALSKNQIVACILTFVVLGALFFLGLGEYVLQDEWWKNIWSYVNLWSHMEELGKGIIDTRRVVYYLTGAVVALYTATRVVEARRWRA